MKIDNVRTLLALAACVAIPAHAGWSSDPANNLIVSDIDGGNTQAKIVAAPDGGFYVSSFDNADNGFDVRLQRLDANGNEIWAHDGVLVADRSYGYTFDYGLAVDSDGNAYLSYNCCENGAPDEHIAVSKIAPDGSLAWGSDGITVSTAAESVYNAYVTPTADGNVVVAWSADSGVRAQKLDANGNALWEAGGVVLDQPSGIKLLGGVQPALAGDAIVSWSNQTGSTRILCTQKLASTDGSALWAGGTAVRVFGAGNLRLGYYPNFVADGAGGGVFYDYDALGNLIVPRVQHIDSDGGRLLGTDGIVATTDTSMKHTDTHAAYDLATGDIYVVWRDTFAQGAQTFDGASAQRIDASGALAWGDTGIVLVPPADSTDGTHAVAGTLALSMSGGLLASWVTGGAPSVDQPITTELIAADGNAVWSTPQVAVKTTRETGRVEGVVGSRGFAAFAWQDGDDYAGASTIRAQNVNVDGSLGGTTADDTIFASGFDGS